METSIVIPAYNESKRIRPFLTSLLTFARKNIRDYEIIIVDDGSKDDTIPVVKNIIKHHPRAKIIGYEQNRGKGGAVQYGVLHAKGRKILFIDADGSIQPPEIPKMISKLDDYDVVVGDRLSKESKVKKSVIRYITSFGFNMLVSLIFQYSFRDNLCGFKGFRKDAAKELFRKLVDRRWVFDVELFYKIKQKKYSVYFLPIAWQEVRGSRVNLFKDPFKWLMRLITLRTHL